MSPADEVVAWSALPGTSAKAQERDQTLPGADPIPQLRARERFKAQIMVAVNVFISQTGVRSGADQA